MKKVMPFILGFLFLLTGCSSAQEAGGAKAILEFRSFDGGGPGYRVVLDSDIVSHEKEKVYAKSNHAELEGAGFSIVYTFTGRKPGETTMIVEERSPIGGNRDHLYSVKVDDGLNVTIDLLTIADLDASVEAIPTLVIAVNGRTFYATPEDNACAKALIEKLSREAIEVAMREYSGFEKVGTLPWSLERSDAHITTEPGDVILYQGDQIAICYDQNTWDFTRLAKIEGVSREELLKAFGSGDMNAGFWAEWSE